MTGAGVETSRVSDGDRDSKSLWEAIGDLDRKVAGVALSVHHTVEEFKQGLESLKQDRHRTGRELTRTPVEKMDGLYLHRKLQKEQTRRFEQGNERFKSTSLVIEDSGTEIECWFHEYVEYEACFMGFYQENNAAESIVVRFKRNLPVFDGFWDIEDLICWIDAIEDFFEEIHPPEYLKCKIVWYKMKGAAYYWWKMLQKDRLSEGKGLISSWPLMKRLLVERFLPTRCLINCPSQATVEAESSMRFTEGSNVELAPQTKSGGLTEACHVKDSQESNDSNETVLASFFPTQDIFNKPKAINVMKTGAEFDNLTHCQLMKCVFEGNGVEAEYESTITVKVSNGVSQASSACLKLTDVPKLDRSPSFVSPTHVVHINPSNLKAMIPVSILNGLGCSSNISRIGSGTGFATKIYSTMVEQTQGQIGLERNNADFLVGEMQVVKFDPGGVASQHKFMNNEPLSTIYCPGTIKISRIEILSKSEVMIEEICYVSFDPGENNFYEGLTNDLGTHDESENSPESSKIETLGKTSHKSIVYGIMIEVLKGEIGLCSEKDRGVQEVLDCEVVKQKWEHQLGSKNIRQLSITGAMLLHLKNRVLHVLNYQNVDLSVEAWNQRRLGSIKWLVGSNMLMKSFSDDLVSLTRSPRGKCMAPFYLVTKFVSFLFDPGGAFCNFRAHETSWTDKIDGHIIDEMLRISFDPGGVFCRTDTPASLIPKADVELRDLSVSLDIYESSIECFSKDFAYKPTLEPLLKDTLLESMLVKGVARSVCRFVPITMNLLLSLRPVYHSILQLVAIIYKTTHDVHHLAA